MKRFLRKQTFRRLDKLSTELLRVAADPLDAEALHDLRVALRRLRQCLSVAASCVDTEFANKPADRLRSFMKRCGAVRNCDVTLQLLDTAGVSDSVLRKHLEAQRRTEMHAVIARIGRWQQRRTLERWRKRLRESLSSAEHVPERTPAATAGSMLPSMVKEWLAAGDLAAAAGSGFQAMHEFRLQGKRLRYTLELFAEVYGTALEPRLRELRSVQARLGAVNDCVTALHLVEGFPDAKTPLTRLLRVRERSFRRHWLRTAQDSKRREELWRSTFSGTEKRNRGRQAKPTRNAG